MQLPFTGGTLCVLPNVTTQMGDYKGALQVSPKVLVGLAYFEIRICHSNCRRGISGPLGNTHHLSLASIATNELVAG